MVVVEAEDGLGLGLDVGEAVVVDALEEIVVEVVGMATVVVGFVVEIVVVGGTGGTGVAVETTGVNTTSAKFALNATHQTEITTVLRVPAIASNVTPVGSLMFAVIATYEPGARGRNIN